MLFMESYLCYCSVRLGVIIVAVWSIVSNFSIHLLKEIFFVHSFLILSDFKYHI